MPLQNYKSMRKMWMEMKSETKLKIKITKAKLQYIMYNVYVHCTSVQVYRVREIHATLRQRQANREECCICILR